MRAGFPRPSARRQRSPLFGPFNLPVTQRHNLAMVFLTTAEGACQKLTEHYGVGRTS
jgi:hypothetical protein